MAFPAVTAPSPGGSTSPLGVAVGKLKGSELAPVPALDPGVEVRNFENPIVADSVCGVCGAPAEPFVDPSKAEEAVVATLSARLPLLLSTLDEAGVSEAVDREYASDPGGSGVLVPPAAPAKLEGEARSRLAGDTPGSTAPLGSTDCVSRMKGERHQPYAQPR